jgi:hypothetical protein
VSKAEKGTNFADILGEDDRIPSSNLTTMRRFTANVIAALPRLWKRIWHSGFWFTDGPILPRPEKRISLTESTFGKLIGVEDTIKHQKAKEEMEHPLINNP